MLCGISDIFARQTILDSLKIFLRSSRSSRSKNTQIMKIMHFVPDSACLNQFSMYIQSFLTIAVFLLAQDALRDLRYFSLTNNLRIVKSFLEISNESLTLKSSKHENHHFIPRFEYFMSKCIHILIIFKVLMSCY